MKRPLLLATFALAGALHGSDDDTAFFEAKVLPLLQKSCYECHSHDKKIKGGLALDSRSGWEQGGDNGPAVQPGDLEKSLVIKAVRYTDADFAMPPKSKLAADEIATLEQWVKQGATDPRVAAGAAKKRTINIEEGRKFWAFQPVANPPVPAVKDNAWPIDAVDRFVLATLEQASLKPVADADRFVWLRRVSLDLTGLPPKPDEIRAFVKDNAPDACEKVVDRLLGSRAFGERWARHWQDLTGYSDMMGTSNSVFAEHAWRYRDYLINAFNSDKPFDEFVREQIAGDLMPAKSVEDRAENITATGFLMVGDVEIVNPDKGKMEADHIDSQINKLGTVFMGMTMGCVRCHDHKFDPIGVEDYYGIAGMLRSSPSTHKIPFGVWSRLNTTELPETPEQLAARQMQEAEHAEKIVALKADQTRLTAEKNALTAEISRIEKLDKGAPTETARGAATVLPATAGEAQAPQSTKPAATTQEPVPDKEAVTKKRDELTEKLRKLTAEIQHAEFFRSKVPKAFAMQDGEKPQDMPVYIRGNPYAPGQMVSRGTMRVASWTAFPQIPEAQSGRLQLAEWLADKRNPLTARVAVNRIWQKLFGEGLVRSVDYFGVRGELPSHPELLDHLASRFMQTGWSQKKFIRSLVLSRVYRMSTANDSLALKVDPDNRLLWRMNRQRLDAEIIRDAMLAVSGELKTDSAGPALVMENPDNTGSLVAKGVNPPSYAHKVPRPSQEFERTVYLPVMRGGFAGPDRVRSFFDFVDPAQIAGQRPQTVVPTQALFLLNNDLLRKRAGALAKTIIEKQAERNARLDDLWLRTLGRPITAEEHEDATRFLEKIEPLLKGPTAERLAWVELCHSLLASNQFIYRI
jgi:Protein of unknown function (DUF1553)/Protein of unknown function (DUF1549)/Planctomycete cytochrome C